MNSTNFILKCLDSIKHLDGIRIRYEYRKSLQTHLIEILPKDIFKTNTEYIEFEMAVEEDFDLLFGNSGEEILFISEDSLMEIKNIDYSF